MQVVSTLPASSCGMPGRNGMADLALDATRVYIYALDAHLSSVVAVEWALVPGGLGQPKIGVCVFVFVCGRRVLEGGQWVASARIGRWLSEFGDLDSARSIVRQHTFLMPSFQKQKITRRCIRI